MQLAVFNEFAASDEQLAAINAVVPLDRAPQPNALAKAPEEIAVLKANAKLFYQPTVSDEEVDATLARLAPIGFKVLHRNPVTSAGCPMKDRVILTFAP